MSESKYFQCHTCGEIMMRIKKPENCSYCYGVTLNEKVFKKTKEITNHEKVERIFDHLEGLKGFDWFWDEIDENIKHDIKNAVLDILNVNYKE